MSGSGVATATSPRGLTVVLTPQAWATAAEVAAALWAQDGTSARCVVLDLQHLRAVEFDLFDVLLDGHVRLHAAGRRLLLVNVLAGAATAFDLLDAGRQLTVVTLERVLSTAWTEVGALEP